MKKLAPKVRDEKTAAQFTFWWLLSQKQYLSSDNDKFLSSLELVQETFRVAPVSEEKYTMFDALIDQIYQNIISESFVQNF